MPTEPANATSMTLGGPGPPNSLTLSSLSANSNGNGNAIVSSPWAGKGGRRNNLYEGTNLNHLLGFSLTPRSGASSSSASRVEYKRSTGGPSFKALPFNKERYVHVQHRFIVRPNFSESYASAWDDDMK
ncbi:hypothetical protein BT69DRAFT_375195 [Atractiella rhizophila]|nr:hypothetical protein BT69DRAFT_375195 [Atractiella rhizophila]